MYFSTFSVHFISCCNVHRLILHLDFFHVFFFFSLCHCRALQGLILNEETTHVISKRKSAVLLLVRLMISSLFLFVGYSEIKRQVSRRGKGEKISTPTPKFFLLFSVLNSETWKEKKNEKIQNFISHLLFLFLLMFLCNFCKYLFVMCFILFRLSGFCLTIFLIVTVILINDHQEMDTTKWFLKYFSSCCHFHSSLDLRLHFLRKCWH